jgi:hypothetical protein
MKRVLVVIIIVYKFPNQSPEEGLINAKSLKEGFRIKAASGVEKQIFHRKLEKIEVPVSLNSIQFF